MSAPIKYYVLIHFAFPAFISGPGEEDFDPMPYDTFAAAEAAGKAQSAAARLGYTVIGWDPVQGGDGPRWFGDRRPPLKPKDDNWF